ncbi:MAG: hypothetical protein KAG66_17185 [Methylococcales bacterium]|nr:hypothetical protein [Methylococcales bacterium]
MIKKIVFITLGIFVFTITLALIQRNRTGECNSPTYLFGDYSTPEIIVERLVTEMSGLPKAPLNLLEAKRSLDANLPIPVYPVSEWEVRSNSVKNTSGLSLVKNNPTFRNKFTLWVRYKGGDEAILAWDSWSYGFVVCPFVNAGGSGPPGHLSIIEFKNNQ